jgi:hypothetical protein
MNVRKATRGYEEWLAGFTTLDQPDLDYKHQQMADPRDPFPFFRGTYYRWVRRWAKACPELADAPRVLVVGDLHVANFGTWRDAEARLVWGVNDFDETAELPYANDLVRLVASARFARAAGHLPVRTAPAADAVLRGYLRGMEEGGRPFVLEERYPRLRHMVTAEREPAAFWAKLTVVRDAPATDRDAAPPAAGRRLLDALPAGATDVVVRFRPRVGMGSLGKPRFVVFAQWDGALVARETKPLTPPATAWAAGADAAVRIGELIGHSVRCPDPFNTAADGWIVRRLGPRSSKVELSDLARTSDYSVLFKAMGRETANVHLATRGSASAILRDLSRRPAGWLGDAARRVSRLMAKDWADWRAGYRPEPKRPERKQSAPAGSAGGRGR